MTETTNNNTTASEEAATSDPMMVALKRAFDGIDRLSDPTDYAPKHLRDKVREASTEPRSLGVTMPPPTPPTPTPTAKSVYTSPLPSAGLRHGGKLPVHLIPPEFSLLLASVLEYGAQKYAPHNFEKGMDCDDLLRGAESHLLAAKAGALYDEESGLPHAAHAAWNMLTFAMQMMREPAVEEVFTRVVLKRRAGNLTDVCREYAAKHGLDGNWAGPELDPTPWHERVTMLRNMIKAPPKG